MLWNRYVGIVVVLWMIVVGCGTVSADVGIIAETHETSGVSAPVCTAPCQCMAESTAIASWGVNGYEMCSKTICGQSSDAMVQYHCIHQVGSSAAAPVLTNAPAQALISGTAIPAAPVAAGITQKSPVGIAIVLVAIGSALMVAATMRRK